MIFQRVCGESNFWLSKSVEKKIILQILVTKNEVLAAQYGDTGIIKARFLLLKKFY
jgi:hypothetical protein